MRFFIRLVTGLMLVASVAFAAVIAFGTANPPPELATISAPFKTADFSTLPALSKVPADTAPEFAYRRFGDAPAKNVVIALHGSTASSSSLLPLGKRLVAEGFTVYAPDIRGHGETGRRGDVDYAGQPDDDLRRMIDLVKKENPGARLVLLGFSLGGGLALRNAANANGALIDSTLLVSPALGASAPTMKTGKDDPWARPYIPRIVALSLLNRIGITAFDGLDAIAYAVAPGSEKIQAARYSWRLLKSMLPQDYRQALKNAPKPIKVVVGEKDELFRVDQFETAIKSQRPDATVTIVPGVNHIGMSVSPEGLDAVVAALK